MAIGGEAADIALDPTRGVLYIANFTANRIDVMTLSNNAIQTSINVPESAELDLGVARMRTGCWWRITATIPAVRRPTR